MSLQSSISASNAQKLVRVGVGVLVKDPQHPHRFFAGIRKGSHGAGTLALPGGHLEMMEDWEECASREVKEEMDLEISNVTFGHVTNDIMVRENKHYVTIFMLADVCTEGKIKPTNMEPHKCEGWKSYSWNDLQEIHQDGSTLIFGPMLRLLLDQPESVLKFLADNNHK